MAVLKVSNPDIVKGALNSVQSEAQKHYRIADYGLKQDTTSFTGGVPNAKQTAEALKDVTPNILNRMCALKDNINEFQNIMINSIGTGLIAPIFIKWNPLSKTDEDTRTYTAMRQPVSAVLAIGTQAAITLPFASALKSMAADGMLGKLYNETPYANPETFLNNLRNDNKILYTLKSIKGAERVEEMDKKSLENLINHTFDDLIDSEAKVLKNLEASAAEQIQTAKYLSKNSDVARKHFEAIQKDLANIKTSKEAGIYLDNKVKSLKQSKADKKLIELTENLRNMAAYNPKTKPSIWDKILHRNPKLADLTEGNKTVIELLNSELDNLTSKSGLINKFSGKTEQEVEQLVRDGLKQEVETSSQAKNFLMDLKSKYSGGKLSIKEIEQEFTQRMGKNVRLGKTEFAKEVMETLKKFTKNNISMFKQVSGMGVSLAMLPVTCTLLNWVYPRFMDLCFPTLSHKNKVAKDVKGGDK